MISQRKGYFASKTYCYKATVNNVINRSTVYLDVDLGFNIHLDNIKYKIATIDGHAYKSKDIDSLHKVLRFINSGDDILIKSVEVNNKMYCDVYTNDELNCLYHYNSYSLNVVDGDTVDIKIDLGFNIDCFERFRLYGINCWETRGSERPRGLLAKERVEELLPIGTNIITKTFKDTKGKYGRYLGELHLLDTKQSINQLLINEGHAVIYE
jgi:micrococcal nuclease